MTNDELKKWASDENTGSDDDLHNHFEAFGRWDWTEVADEGRRVYGAMFYTPIKQASPVGMLISAVSAQASHGAYAAIAAALGMPADSLRVAVAEWSEKQDDLPPPASLEAFKALVDKYEAAHQQRRSEATR